jgi:adenylate cyclase
MRARCKRVCKSWRNPASRRIDQPFGNFFARITRRGADPYPAAGAGSSLGRGPVVGAGIMFARDSVRIAESELGSPLPQLPLVAPIAGISLRQIKSLAHCDVCEIKYDAEFDKSVELKVFGQSGGAPCQPPNLLPGRAGRQAACPEPDLAGAGDGKNVEMAFSETRCGCNRPRWRRRSSFRQPTCQAPPKRLVVTCQADRFVLSSEAAEATAEVRLANPLAYPVLASWHQLAWSEDILTAARVTNWQEFRDLFANEVISPNEQVTVGSQVVLFTDLRGSTALYHDMGDARAYMLVRNHFEVLTKAIAARHGAVVKTIGDAVMATFSRVDDALEAVRQAFEQLPAANPGLAAPLILKASLHVGPCLAVNANDKLDYFGTTVNLAARMVECCDGGDLTVSDELFQRPETARFLQAATGRTADAPIRML